VRRRALAATRGRLRLRPKRGRRPPCTGPLRLPAEARRAPPAATQGQLRPPSGGAAGAPHSARRPAAASGGSAAHTPHSDARSAAAPSGGAAGAPTTSPHSDRRSAAAPKGAGDEAGACGFLYQRSKLVLRARLCRPERASARRITTTAFARRRFRAILALGLLSLGQPQSSN